MNAPLIQYRGYEREKKLQFAIHLKRKQNTDAQNKITEDYVCNHV